ncbi:MAG: hypothetical protein K5770_04050 [Lachnospiraceae bacterium]|nr:hypothetical protein [Lachnospiraceae bacterium]
MMKNYDQKKGINALNEDDLEAVTGGANLNVPLGTLKTLRTAKSVMPILATPFGTAGDAGSSQNVQYMDMACEKCGKILHVNVMESEAVCDNPACKHVNHLAG